MFLFSFVLLATTVLVFKVCNQVAPSILNLPCFKALINESYAYFLSSHDFHTNVDIFSILSNT